MLIAGAGVVGAGAVAVRLWIAAGLAFHYDEHWHRFVATVRPVGQMVAELRDVAHPPLAMLVLRVIAWVNESAAASRLLGFLPAMGSLVLFYLCARRLKLAPELGLLAVLLAALSPAHAMISVSTRGYALAMAWELAAFAALLRWIDQPEGRRVPARALLYLSLAMWTAYNAIFVAAAFAPVWWLARRIHPAGDRARRKDLRDGGLFALSAVALVAYLISTIGLGNFGHTDPFLPAGEPRWQFALLGLARDLHLLAAVPLSRWLAAAVVLVLVVALVRLQRRLPRTTDELLAVAPALMLGQVLLLLLVAALLGRYPFGGAMRHQFVLFPFLVLTVVQLLARVGPRWLAVAYAGAVVWGVFALRAPLPEETVWHAAWAEDAAATRRQLGQSCLYLPVYSTYGFYGALPSSRWRAVDSCGPRCVRFVVEDQHGSFTVLKDSATWEVGDPPDAAFAARLAQVSRACSELWVLSIDRVAPETGFSEVAEPLERAGLLLRQRVSLGAGGLWQLQKR